MPGLSGTSLDEFAFQLLNWKSQGWLVLVVSGNPAPGDVAVRIVGLIQTLGNMATDLIRVTRADSLIHITRKSQRASGTPSITWGYERFNAKEWSRLDLARSALATDHPVAMIMSTDAFGMMQAEAPNLANWTSGAWEGAGILPLTEKERATRLTRLRQRYKKSDAEVISLARADHGSIEADFVEWLILLGKDDVLGSG